MNAHSEIGYKLLREGHPHLLVASIAVGTLAERITRMAMVLSVAKRTWRVPVIAWQPGPGCTAAFGDVFDIEAGTPSGTLVVEKDKFYSQFLKRKAEKMVFNEKILKASVRDDAKGCKLR